MSRRRDLQRRCDSLAEIRNIMNSMRTLAYLETRKLDRFLPAQQAVVTTMEDAAQELLCCFPELHTDATPATAVCVVIGSERGFCGDYNHALVDALHALHPAGSVDCPLLVCVGRKLAMLLEADTRVEQRIDGAGVLEEVTSRLNDLIRVLMTLQNGHGPLALFCLYHVSDGGITMRRLLPPFRQLPADRARPGYPPVLNLAPRELLGELTDHYLFAALHEVLYTALLAENQQRARHLQGAVRHLDEETERLGRRVNILRQEEIIDEIEVILLGATETGEPGQPA